jgi:hypothetical protein
MGKIEASMASTRIMDVMMLFHTLHSSLRVSSGGIWIFQKKGVTIEEVIEYRALQKAHSGLEEETGLLFYLFNTLHIPSCLFYKQL